MTAPMIQPLETAKARLWSSVLLQVWACSRCDTPKRWTQPLMTRFNATPAHDPAGPARVYHLGHTLSGRDCPRCWRKLAVTGTAKKPAWVWGATPENPMDPT